MSFPYLRIGDLDAFVVANVEPEATPLEIARALVAGGWLARRISMPAALLGALASLGRAFQ